MSTESMTYEDFLKLSASKRWSWFRRSVHDLCRVLQDRTSMAFDFCPSLDHPGAFVVFTLDPRAARRDGVIGVEDFFDFTPAQRIEVFAKTFVGVARD